MFSSFRGLFEGIGSWVFGNTAPCTAWISIFARGGELCYDIKPDLSIPVRRGLKDFLFNDIYLTKEERRDRGDSSDSDSEEELEEEMEEVRKTKTEIFRRTHANVGTLTDHYFETEAQYFNGEDADYLGHATMHHVAYLLLDDNARGAYVSCTHT